MHKSEIEIYTTYLCHGGHIGSQTIKFPLLGNELFSNNSYCKTLLNICHKNEKWKFLAIDHCLQSGSTLYIWYMESLVFKLASEKKRLCKNRKIAFTRNHTPKEINVNWFPTKKEILKKHDQANYLGINVVNFPYLSNATMVATLYGIWQYSKNI